MKNYKGREDQIWEIMKYVTRENYQDMKKRANNLDSKDFIVGSSNFGKFATLFESEDAAWIDAINCRLGE